MIYAKIGDIVPLQILVVDRNGSVLTGGVTFVVDIRRVSDNAFWDFSSNSFKTSGWTTRQATLTEISSTNAPGWYYYSSGWPTTSQNNDFYYITFSDTGTTAGNLPASDDVQIAAWVSNLDVAVSTRSSPGALANVLLSGTASAGGTNTLTLAGGSSTDDLYRYSDLAITSGTGAGQVNTILAYNGTTKVATVARNWTVQPDNTSVFSVIAKTQPLITSTGVLQAATSTTVTLSATSSTSDNYYNDTTIAIRSGTGAGQVRQISSYVGSTKVATLYEAWTTTPDNTSAYEILPLGRSKVMSILAGAVGSSSFATDAIDANALAASAVTEIANAVANLDISAFTNAKLLGGAVTRLRKWLTWTSSTLNKKQINASTQKFEVYDDDGVTLLDNPAVSDSNGNSVTPQTGELSRIG